MKLFICGLLIVLGANWSHGQNANIEQEIRELSTKKWQWMADKNADSLTFLFHDKAKFVHMGGAGVRNARLTSLEVDSSIIKRPISMKSWSKCSTKTQ